MKRNLYIIANAALGKGLSGSDRIFIELARRLVKRDTNVHICVWEEGYEMCQRQDLRYVKYNKWFLGKLKNLPFIVNYFFRIISGCFYALFTRIENSENTYVYTASDFWQDFFPALIIKIKYPKVKFISSFYLAAPNPLVGFRKKYEEKIQIPTFKDLFYYLGQLPTTFLIPKISDLIFVTSEPDQIYFHKQGFPKHKIIIIMGGVTLENYENLPSLKKEIDAVFYGRFHPQKGVIEIVDIWKKVVEKLPYAKLSMIGSGPLFEEVSKKIKLEELIKNITLEGHLDDGPRKWNIFSKSRIVVHPAVYDSGGMASAEVMALKIPGISFDLEALKTYYPLGMLKVKCFDLDLFAEKIIKLLTDEKLYNQTAEDALTCVHQNFNWDSKVDKILKEMKEIENVKK